MKNDYIKQALVLSIERFKIFLTLTAVVFGAILTTLQNLDSEADKFICLMIIIFLLFHYGVFLLQ
jgi:hypothetical protein